VNENTKYLQQRGCKYKSSVRQNNDVLVFIVSSMTKLFNETLFCNHRASLHSVITVHHFIL
jgi:hypothetical protein